MRNDEQQSHPRAACNDLISFFTFHISTARSVASQPAPLAPAGVGVGALGADITHDDGSSNRREASLARD